MRKLLMNKILRSMIAMMIIISFASPRPVYAKHSQGSPYYTESNTIGAGYMNAAFQEANRMIEEASKNNNKSSDESQIETETVSNNDARNAEEAIETAAEEAAKMAAEEDAKKLAEAVKLAEKEAKDRLFCLYKTSTELGKVMKHLSEEELRNASRDKIDEIIKKLRESGEKETEKIVNEAEKYRKELLEPNTKKLVRDMAAKISEFTGKVCEATN